eukprot:224005-Rhodomonas_salina.1
MGEHTSECVSMMTPATRCTRGAKGTSILMSLVVFAFFAGRADAFGVSVSLRSPPRPLRHRSLASTQMAETTADLGTRIGGAVASFIVESPVYPTMVKKAQQTMKDTAALGGIDWDEEVEKLEKLGGWDEALESVTGVPNWTPDQLPDYFKQKFHAYGEGNLCWQAAKEQLVAGKAVGVRNFP